MIEHVVSLRPRAVGAIKGRPGASEEDRADNVFLRLFAVAPRGAVRLRLWNQSGREPKNPASGDLHFADRLSPEDEPYDLPLKAEEGFDGCTLTWVIRLQAVHASPYEVRLTLLQGGARVPGGEFAYTGQVDGLQQLSGRFHFRQAAG